MNEDFPEKLIEAMRKCVRLWDVTSKSFKVTKAKENVWKCCSGGEAVKQACTALYICTHIGFIGWGYSRHATMETSGISLERARRLFCS